MPKIPVYSIDSGVPVPESATPTRQQIPIHMLEVGDSILFPASKRAVVAPFASRLKKTEGKVFVIKKMDEDNVRIWRVK